MELKIISSPKNNRNLFASVNINNAYRCRQEGKEKCHGECGLMCKNFGLQINNMEWKLAIQISNFTRQIAQHYDDFAEDKTMASNVNLLVNKIFSFAHRWRGFWCCARSGWMSIIVYRKSRHLAYTSNISWRPLKMRFSLLINNSFHKSKEDGKSDNEHSEISFSFRSIITPCNM